MRQPKRLRKERVMSKKQIYDIERKLQIRQSELKKSLSPELANFYQILQGFVNSGNCLFDCGTKIVDIKSVELATGTNTKVVRGLVFTGE